MAALLLYARLAVGVVLVAVAGGTDPRPIWVSSSYAPEAEPLTSKGRAPHCYLPKPPSAAPTPGDVAGFCKTGAGQRPAGAPALDDARAAAWRFAPSLWFHALEQYTLADADEYLAAADLVHEVDGGGSWGPATTPNILNLTLSAANCTSIKSKTTCFNTAGCQWGGRGCGDMTLPWTIKVVNATDEARLRSGSGFDAKGRSKAPAYYSLREGRNGSSWVYTYWLW